MKQLMFATFLGIICLMPASAAGPWLEAREEMGGPYTIAYRIFTGDYRDNSPVFSSLIRELRAAGIASTRTIGIYLDDPKTTAPQERRSVIMIK